MFSELGRGNVREHQGLDRGHHQWGWDPSFGVPASWNGKVRAGSESKCEVKPKLSNKDISLIHPVQNQLRPLYRTNPSPRPPSPRPQHKAQTTATSRKIRRKETIRQPSSFSLTQEYFITRSQSYLSLQKWFPYQGED